MTTPDTLMSIQLPPQAIFPQACRLENGWSDHYGAIQVATAYAGLACPPRYSLQGVWQHGCLGPWQNLSAEALCYGAPAARPLFIGVARQDQADLLVANGYTRARAIGLPIVYTPETHLPRLPGSLLVVPTHTLNGDQFPDRTPFERYAEEIQAAAGAFRRVVVCIHPSCQKNGLWVDEFSSRGFEIVFGAQTSDANALLRMRMLFEQFESVTTNGWGSHVAYALAFGARVSLYGTQPQKTEADYLRDASWAANPAGLRAMLAGETLAREREYLQAYRQPPGQGVADVTQGRMLIGWHHRLTPNELEQVLTTIVPILPDFMVVHRARGERQATRHEAARLVAAREPVEATKLLLQVVRTAALSKNAKLIHETLVEIAADLQTLDPPRAAQLAAQASVLAARVEAARRSAA